MISETVVLACMVKHNLEKLFSCEGREDQLIDNVNLH